MFVELLVMKMLAKLPIVTMLGAPVRDLVDVADELPSSDDDGSTKVMVPEAEPPLPLMGPTVMVPFDRLAVAPPLVVMAPLAAITTVGSSAPSIVTVPLNVIARVSLMVLLLWSVVPMSIRPPETSSLAARFGDVGTDASSVRARVAIWAVAPTVTVVVMVAVRFEMAEGVAIRFQASA